MIIVLGSVAVRADAFEEALALSQAHCARSRLEPGCVSHAVHRATDEDHRLVFVERWEDRPALHQHFKVPESREFVKALSALATVPPQMVVYDGLEVHF